LADLQLYDSEFHTDGVLTLDTESNNTQQGHIFTYCPLQQHLVDSCFKEDGSGCRNINETIAIKVVFWWNFSCSLLGLQFVWWSQSTPVFCNLFSAAEPYICVTITRGTPHNDSWIQWLI